MRILLMAVGSRGDSEPMCSLAAALAEKDEVECIELFLQTDAQDLVPRGTDKLQKVQYHELPFTQMDFYKWAGQKREPPQAGAGHANPRVQFLGIVTDIMGELVLPCYSKVMETVLGGSKPTVDAIVASSLARQLAMEVEWQLRISSIAIPIYLVQLQNLVPTRDFPHYSQTDAFIEALTNGGRDKDGNLETYLELERLQLQFLSAHVEPQLGNLPSYRKREPPLDFDKDMLPALTGTASSDSCMDIWMVNAVSTHIVPANSDAGKKVLNVGSLADTYVPEGFVPPAGLVSFLERHVGKPPICFGYGSMPFEQAQLVVDAVREAKYPAVLVGSSMMGVFGKLQEASSEEEKEWMAWAKENVYCVANVPYPWLLPQCSMMFSHGGAGVLHSTLRAGIPAVISPLIGDQFAFAKYVDAKGWGVNACDKLTSLSKEDILKSIPKAVKCQPACRQLGTAMASGEPAGSHSGKNGRDLLAKAIIDHVHEKRRS
mmetsp:Transcript_27773/g.50734  ORF Transcript_27773/g.50734 Transcript_27773/m.50734 type:complete len:488 (-) Transcript_27773:83-1546(-)